MTSDQHSVVTPPLPCPLPPLSTHPMWRGCGSCRQTGLQVEAYQSSQGFPEGRIIYPRELQTSGRRAALASRTTTEWRRVQRHLRWYASSHHNMLSLTQHRVYFSSTYNICNGTPLSSTYNFCNGTTSVGRIGPDQVSSLVFSLTR